MFRTEGGRRFSASSLVVVLGYFHSTHAHNLRVSTQVNIAVMDKALFVAAFTNA